MPLALRNRHASEELSRRKIAESIDLIVGNSIGTYGLNQFYRNPHLSMIVLNLHEIETALAKVAKDLQSSNYTVSKFLSDMEPQVEAMDELYRKCTEEKRVSYAYSNRYHNDAENP
ncbi:MAG: hypothetical protein ACP5MZ_01825 [Candidatus Micrarchaeia archaeon]